jgi:multidrug efflux pump
MTSIAFVAGTLPLVFATGAGSASRIAIGTAVVGGMLSATLLAIFFVPAFFVSVSSAFRVRPNRIVEPRAPVTREISSEHSW